MSERYKIRNQDNPHFITFATAYWLDIFTRDTYKQVLIDSFRYCLENKGLELFAWVIMTNHLHLIARAVPGKKLENIIRDFKKYTAVMVYRAIEANQQESRKLWMLWLLNRAGERSKKHEKYRVWQNQYHPIELHTAASAKRCLQYIHQNPVKEGWVEEPEDYRYSSARNYAGLPGILPIQFL